MSKTKNNAVIRFWKSTHDRVVASRANENRFVMMNRKEKEEKMYIAHIKEGTGEVQTVQEHSEDTARLCREYSIPKLKAVTYAIGLLHDVGKMQESFQQRIQGRNIRVEHSTCGALAVKELYPGPVGLLMEYCIAGHHSGLPDGGYPGDTEDQSTLCGRLKRRFEDFSAYKEELEIPEINVREVTEFLAADCDRSEELLVYKFAFLTRYAFSCLVDADSTDTARFCNGDTTEPLTADFEACLRKVNEKLASFVCTTSLQKTRSLLQKQVFDKVDADGEIFLMNMPTGTGKTLCSVKFALERIICRGGKKRIIYVIPYNSIIDQTVCVLEELFGKDAPILRHQSTFSYDEISDAKGYEKDDAEAYRKAAKSAVENWDVSSVIVTTAVQFFESVYGNKRGKLRKVHNMADSILIFDEAHLMPLEYLQPCLRAIAYITKYLNSEAVFLTATMPDFPKLLCQYALKSNRIVDLIEDTSTFSRFRKCAYRVLGRQSSDAILEKAMGCPSSLIIVNKKASARRLYKACSGKKYHLSTYMTAYDRERVIREITEELKRLEKDYPGYQGVPDDRRITIISTSLIEAGVDLDLFAVFRELSGLDSILQAGGRCNREGRRSGAEVYIFEFDDKNVTEQDIKSNITAGLLEKYEDISCPQSIREYYDRLLSVNRDRAKMHTITQMCSAFSDIPFAEYAGEFELIDSRTISLVIPRDEQSSSMIENLKYTGGRIDISRKLQKYACTISHSELDELFSQHVVDDFGTGILCLTNKDYYEKETGIQFEARDYFID